MYASYDNTTNLVPQIPMQNDIGFRTANYISKERQDSYHQFFNDDKMTTQIDSLSQSPNNQQPNYQPPKFRQPTLTHIETSSKYNTDELVQIYNYISLMMNNNIIIEYLKKINKLDEKNNISELHDKVLSYIDEKKSNLSRKNELNFNEEFNNKNSIDLLSTELIFIGGAILLYILYIN